MPTIAYISLGSNIGDKIESIRKALGMLERAGRITAVSSLYRTEAVGYPEQEEFLNAVVALETNMSPLSLLATCHVIEDALGRRRLMHWGPRTIDLDILLYGDKVIDNGELTIPHPLMAERRFVLVPLCEIAPRAVHPVLNKTAEQLLKKLQDPHAVRKFRPKGRAT